MSGAKKKAERRATIAEMGMTEREKRELKEAQTKRRNTILATVGGVIAVILVAILLIWHTGVFARHTTAVKFSQDVAGAGGETSLTVADMEYFYHMALNNAYSQEQSMAELYTQYGMEYTPSFDPNEDLKTQYIDADQTQSYYDYFVSQAKANATQVIALSNAAKAAGYTLSEDGQASLDSAGSDLDAQVEQYGFGTRDNYLKAIYGRTMTEKVYFKNLERNILASDYYTSRTEPMGNYSDEELTAYYTDHADNLDSYDYQYVYFDGTAQSTTDADGNSVEPTEEESAAALAAAKQSAEDLMAALNSEKNSVTVDEETGESVTRDFATVASDLGSNASAQTGSSGANFAGSPYADWLKDSAREDGDVDLFEVEGAGYYVVEFNARYRNDDPTMDVRHILAAFQANEDVEHEHDENDQHVYTDEEKAAAHDLAQSYLNEYLSGDQTAEAFGELAEKYSDDGRDEDGNLYTAGGLYTGVKMGDMVQPFEDWCFDSSRQPGDTGLVQTTYGWHVMYFQDFHRPVWMDNAESAKQSADQQAFLDEVTAGYDIVSGSWAKLGLPETETEPEA